MFKLLWQRCLSLLASLKMNKTHNSQKDRPSHISPEQAVAAVDKSQFDPNQNNAKQTFTSLAILGVVAIIGYALWCFLSLSANTASTDNTNAYHSFAKVKDATFTAEDNQSALTQQQYELRELNTALIAQQKSIEQLTQSLQSQAAHYKEDKENLYQKLTDSERKTQEIITEKIQANNNTYHYTQTQTKGTNTHASHHNTQQQEQSNIPSIPSLTTTSPVYPVESFQVKTETKETAKPYQRSYKNYVPTGSFCRAIVLGGADASAAVDAQGEASPMNFKIMDNCRLPNGKQSRLKGAFVTASVYGKISSERGMVRLEHLSLIRKDGSILEIPVEGTAFDTGGKNGIRGIPVMRNDKVIMNAGLSGMLSGLGSSAQQYSQSQSVSPLGQTTVIDAAKILPNALGAGASTAFGEISKYYIELAKQYSPVIQLNAGAIVDLVFLRGFPLLDEERIASYEAMLEKEREDKDKKAESIQLPTTAQLSAMNQNTQSSQNNQHRPNQAMASYKQAQSGVQ